MHKTIINPCQFWQAATPYEKGGATKIMQVRSKLEIVSDELADMSLQIRQMLEDGKVDEGELRELAALARQQMPDAINQVESAIVDNVLVSQILKLGHENAPNRHVKCRIYDLEAVRASRQREAANGTNPPAA